MHTIKVSDEILEWLDKLNIEYEYWDEKIVYKNSSFHESMFFIFGILVWIVITTLSVIYTWNPCKLN